MAVNSPLDTLKHAVLQVDNLIGVAVDDIAGSCCDGDHEGSFEILDAARRELWAALAEHIPGIVFDIVPKYTPEAMRSAFTYDDGTPVRRRVALSDDVTVEYYPRLNGDEREFVETLSGSLKPALHIVADLEPEQP